MKDDAINSAKPCTGSMGDEVMAKYDLDGFGL